MAGQTSDWRIQDRMTAGLRISEDDPVLWRSQFAIYSTYFAGTPRNPYRAASDLLSAVPATARALRVQPNELADLLALGSGSLGSLPIPVIRICQPILKRHGVEAYPLGPDESDAATVGTVLLFGDGSFVIAERFHGAELPAS